MTRLLLVLTVVASSIASAAAQSIGLPSSKTLQPVPGSPQLTNSFPAAMELSPDGKYLAILNSGYGSAESKFEQSIALLDTATNQLRDFPDARFRQDARQTYFVGLAWSGDGRELYASVASITDPEGKKPGDTGNGIAVYRFQNGSISAERFLKLPLVTLAQHQRFTYEPKAIPD